MAHYQKWLTVPLPSQWPDILSQLKQTASPGVTQAELLRQLLRAGLDAAQSEDSGPCSLSEEKAP